MKTFRLRIFAALALVISLLLGASTLTVSTAQTRRQSAGKQSATKRLAGTVLFVVTNYTAPSDTPEYGMDALVIINKGKYIDPVEDNGSNAMKPFAEKYFKAGNKYRLLFGGGEAGTATVQSSNEGCNTIHSKVSVEGSVKISGQIRGLATNSETLGKKASSRRALTASEREAVMTLVKSIYRQHQTSNSLMHLLKVGNLTATDLDGDGKFEVIGDFQIEANPTSTTGARRDLFLIATPSGAGYKAELANFQSYRKVEDFGRGIGFVDQLDIDGDGIAEVVAVNEGFDGYGYSIYKKQAGRWRVIYSVMGDAC